MEHLDEECIWVRTDVWLDTGDGDPIRVQTRKLCRSGAFLEYAGPLPGRSVEIVFPEPGTRGGGRHVDGEIAGAVARWHLGAVQSGSSFVLGVADAQWVVVWKRKGTYTDAAIVSFRVLVVRWLSGAGMRRGLVLGCVPGD